MSRSWTRPAEVRAWLGKKWQSGALLTAFAEGMDWEPLSVPLRGPVAGEIAERLAEVQEWAAEWGRAGRGPLRVEYKKVGGRQVGSNMIPARAWIDGYDHVWELLGVRAEVRRFSSLVQATAESCPRLVPWVRRRPMQLLRLADRWDKLLATVRWIDERQSPGMYLRQLDLPGVDTKFIERHRGVLAELLDLQLAPDRIDADAADFAGRYRFRRKPGYVRFRWPGLCGFSELSVRTDEFAAPPSGASRAYVVENEITYLAFPLPGDAVVIFGGGYAVDVLEPLGWLTDLDLVLLGRHRHPRVRDPEPAAAPLRPRAVHADGPRDVARTPRPVGDRATADGRRPGPPGCRGDRALPRPRRRRAGPLGAAGAGTNPLRRDRASPGLPP